MPVTYILDFAGATAEQYDAVMERMDLGGRLPPNAQFHCAGPHDGGWRVIDVYDSTEAFDRFAQEKIGPLTAEQGISQPQIRRHEVTQLRRGHDEDVTFAQMIYLPGIDRQTFEGVDERVLGAAGFPPDGCVFHVNGPYDGGHYVMDAWATQGHYDRFRDDHILPAIKAAGLEAAPRLEHLILHASLRQPAAAGAVA